MNRKVILGKTPSEARYMRYFNSIATEASQCSRSCRSLDRVRWQKTKGSSRRLAMQYYGSNISINGSDMEGFVLDILGPGNERDARLAVERYEKRTRGLLNQIDQKLTGKALLRAIHKIGSRVVTIKPYVNNKRDEFGARVVEDDPEGATKRGKSIFGRGGDLRTTSEGLTGYGDKGTGLGSDTTIYITPNEWVTDDTKIAIGLESPPKGYLPDSVMVHELTHALRDIAGLNFFKPVPFQKRFVKDKDGKYKRENSFTNIEEWFAVLIENIYLSECGECLRVAYSDDFGHYTEKQFIRLGMNRAHMRQFRREHSDFFSDLREIDVPFNPTRLILDI